VRDMADAQAFIGPHDLALSHFRKTLGEGL
jgi:hypothetical protein